MGKEIDLYTEEERTYIIAVGDRVRELRKEYGITQNELCRRIDMSPQTISAIENGRKDCLVTTIYLICKAFGISVSDFYNF